MNGPWAVVFYRDSRGREPVRAWLDELTARSPSITYLADPERRMVLLTSFRKRGRRTERREIDRAMRVMEDWLQGMERA